jgi:hypothetical protein
MKKLVLAAFLASSVCSVAAFADTMSGVISDSHCGVKHNAAGEATEKCVNGCLKGAAKPVLVSDGKVYQLDEASQSKAAALAGKSVNVDGKLEGDTVTVSSISEAK